MLLTTAKGEKGWLIDWLKSIFDASGATFDCDTMERVFFTGGCPANRLGGIYDAIASDAYPDFIGMHLALNSDMKGMVRDRPWMNIVARSIKISFAMTGP